MVARTRLNVTLYVLCLSGISTWNRPPAVPDGCRVSHKQLQRGDRFVLPVISRTETLPFRK